MFHLELEIFSAGESVRREFKIPELGKIFIGRLDCDLLLESKLVSRKHLGFAIKGGKLIAGDMKSSHGTLLNGNPLNRALVKAGDRFELGPYKIRILTFRKERSPSKAPKKNSESRPVQSFSLRALLRRFAVTGVTAALALGVLIRQQYIAKKSELPEQAYRPYQYQGDRSLSGISEPVPVDVNGKPLVMEAGIGDR